MPSVQCVIINSLKDAITELVKAGVTPSAIEAASARAVFRCLRVWNISPAGALALKDAALHGGVTAAAPHPADGASSADMLLFGTLDDFRRTLATLHPHIENEEIRSCAEQIKTVLMNVEGSVPPRPCEWKDRALRWGEKTFIMGIINTTPDSFYSYSRKEGPEAAIETARAMIEAGADILDIGGESSRPGAEPVSAEEERERVVPAIKAIRSEFPDTFISIDTYRAATAAAALEAGADIINDISALAADPDMAHVAAESGAPVCIMHMQGTPRNMQRDPKYDKDVCGEIIAFLKHRIEFAVEAGVSASRIIIDPGIGFGKTVSHNIEILGRLGEVRALGRPILIGASRKSFIGATLDLPEEDRLEGSLAVGALAIASGADILRVHDVAETVRAARIADAIVRRPRGATQVKTRAQNITDK